jgi:hypothetical protein
VEILVYLWFRCVEYLLWIVNKVEEIIVNGIARIMWCCFQIVKPFLGQPQKDTEKE